MRSRATVRTDIGWGSCVLARCFFSVNSLNLIIHYVWQFVKCQERKICLFACSAHRVIRSITTTLEVAGIHSLFCIKGTVQGWWREKGRHLSSNTLWQNMVMYYCSVTDFLVLNKMSSLSRGLSSSNWLRSPDRDTVANDWLWLLIPEEHESWPQWCWSTLVGQWWSMSQPRSTPSRWVGSGHKPE